MHEQRRRVTDKKNLIIHLRDNWILWMTFITVSYGVFGKPAKDIGTWAFKIGTLSTKFDIHCVRDSTWRIDVLKFMDASAQDRKEIRKILGEK
jgi:hypothetical protein